MFIANNRVSFHLWWKENLVRHQKVSKHYENDCRSSNFNKALAEMITGSGNSIENSVRKTKYNVNNFD